MKTIQQLITLHSIPYAHSYYDFHRLLTYIYINMYKFKITCAISAFISSSPAEKSMMKNGGMFGVFFYSDTEQATNGIFHFKPEKKKRKPKQNKIDRLFFLLLCLMFFSPLLFRSFQLNANYMHAFISFSTDYVFLFSRFNCIFLFSNSIESLLMRKWKFFLFFFFIFAFFK